MSCNRNKYIPKAPPPPPYAPGPKRADDWEIPGFMNKPRKVRYEYYAVGQSEPYFVEEIEET